MDSEERYCLDCRYPLRGLREGGESRCPECGRGFDLGDVATFTTTLRRPAWSWLIAAGSTGLYPLVFLCLVYLHWLVAWASLGHRPRTYGDARRSINNITSAMFDTERWMIEHSLWVFLLSGFLLFFAAVWAPWRYLGRARLPLFLLVPLTPLAWCLPLLLIRLDPGGVFDWLFD